MIDKIKSIKPLLKNNQHDFFVSKQSNQAIYIYEVAFEKSPEGLTGSIEKTAKFKVGDTVDVSILQQSEGKKPYYKLKEVKNDAFTPKPSVLAPNNTLVGIESTKLAIEIYAKTKKVYDFSNPEYISDISKLSRKIAKLTKEVIRTLDAED